jgi:hypothetical protein
VVLSEQAVTERSDGDTVAFACRGVQTADVERTGGDATCARRTSRCVPAVGLRDDLAAEPERARGRGATA